MVEHYVIIHLPAGYEMALGLGGNRGLQDRAYVKHDSSGRPNFVM